MPATNVWLDGTGAWNVPGNWSDGVPTSDDVLIFGGPSNLGVNFPTTSGLSFAGLVMQSSYTGTLGFQAPITFGSYQQYGGYTFQWATTAEVTATGTFVWTGGGVNTSTNPATYELKGVTTGQIGTDTTTLVSGAKFVIEKLGSVTSWVKQHGVLNANNAAGIEVLEDCTFDQRQLIVQQGNKPAAPGLKLTNGKGNSSDGGTFTSVLILGGKFTANSDTVTVSEKVPGTDWSVICQQNGTIAIKIGATLKATDGVYMSTGALQTLTVPAPPGGGAEPTVATIDGVFRIDGDENHVNATIELGMADAAAGTQSGYSVLEVTGRTYVWGGTFKPKLQQSGALRDKILTKEMFNVAAHFTITPANIPTTIGAGYIVMETEVGFTDDIDPNNGNPTDFELMRVGGEKQIRMKVIE